ncbi:hypothetical protein [Dactylosporangium sp. NPDC051541]|uniref:hypothetical protein n=1 Tax=Dactylosporangium sp. NPDC051541 TaxID=3363977 RepID=UPI0037BC524D
MSTFMALAAVDLPAAADPAAYLETLPRPEPVAVWITKADEYTRLSFYAEGGNAWLAESIARSQGWTRALIALDHDEYGAEHLVLSNGDGHPARVQHVYLHWDATPGADFERVTLSELAPAPGLAPAADGTLNDARVWSAVAALYNADPSAVARAGRYAEEAHTHLGTVFTPFEPWWDAVGAVYPPESGGDLTVV